MTKAKISSVDEYIAAQPEAVRPMLSQLRGIIAEALPDAEECISYAIPTFKLGGIAVLYFAAWKRHFSLYPASEALRAALADELAAYIVSKGTIRFPLDAPLPSTLVRRIASLRAKEIRSRG